MSLKMYGAFESVLLEVEVHPKSVSEFEKRYRSEASGASVDREYCQMQPNKWGVECRVYFVGEDWIADNLQKLGYHVEHRTSGYRNDYPYRVNSGELFWKLIRHGYRLGENEPIPLED